MVGHAKTPWTLLGFPPREHRSGAQVPLHNRLKTSGGVNKLKRLMANAVPVEFRMVA